MFRAKVLTRAAAAAVPVAAGMWYCFGGSNEENDGTTVLVVGGGTAGIGIAAQLRRKGQNVRILEPRDTHYYQPLWTLVGGGLKQNTQSAKPMKDVIPRGVEWIRDSAASLDPDNNTVTTKNNKTLEYDYLVVATGMESRFDKIPGLQETIGKNGVVSIYDYDLSQTAQEILTSTTGKIVFTQHADSPIKCGGAPQKIMWLTEDNAKRSGKACSFHWFAPQPGMFPVPKYGDILSKLADERGINRHHGMRLVEVDGPNQTAVFEDTKSQDKTSVKFDALHVIPFMSPPAAVRESPLADAKGFVDVDKHTLQSKRYPNVFSAGDVANLPTSKTMAAVTKQAPVLIHNLLAHKHGRKLTASYDGYTSCPITTARNRLLLAEFKYGGKLAETFPLLQSQPRGLFMFFKETAFPFAYFNLFLPGYWYGPRAVFPPRFPNEKDEEETSRSAERK